MRRLNIAILFRGLDFGSYGIRAHNPELLGNFVEGDLYDILQLEIAAGEKYHYLMLKNVLEHVLDPGDLLSKARSLLAKNGLIYINVPNDFSLLQKFLYQNNCVSREYWLCYPDHLNYFNQESLLTFVKSNGFYVVDCISDYPIELDLLDNASNYVDEKVGMHSHKKRLQFERFMATLPIEASHRLYSAYAEIGLGRCISVFIRDRNQTS